MQEYFLKKFLELEKEECYAINISFSVYQYISSLNSFLNNSLFNLIVVYYLLEMGIINSSRLLNIVIITIIIIIKKNWLIISFINFIVLII